MPVYIYRCETCKKEVEILTQDYELRSVLEFCPKCNARKLHLKAIAATNFKFKGGQINKDFEK